MRIAINRLTAAASLALFGLSAHAGCVDPRTAARGGVPALHAMHLKAPSTPATGSVRAIDNIVGTWHVSYTTAGSPGGEAFIQWHSDGTEWENINFPILNGNICVGSWKAVDLQHVSRYHVGWLYAEGSLVGYFTETETNLVARDGNSYTGVNDFTAYDLNGNMLVELPGTSSATRISP